PSRTRAYSARLAHARVLILDTGVSCPLLNTWAHRSSALRFGDGQAPHPSPGRGVAHSTGATLRVIKAPRGYASSEVSRKGEGLRWQPSDSQAEESAMCRTRHN